MRGLVFLLVAALLGCGDLAIRRTPPPPPAEPPAPGDDGTGSPPDWTGCETAWLGQYYNLDPSDPAVDDPEAVLTLDDLSWWDAERLAFQSMDTSLDFGTAWWPVDDGLEDDPALFAVRWTAWIRAWSDTNLQIALGAASDAWVLIGGEVVASIEGSEAFEPELVELDRDSGQARIEVRFAHRLGDEDGMLFRVAGGDVTICAPEFE